MRDHPGRRRIGLLVAMVALQAAFLAVRSRLIGAPLGAVETAATAASIAAGLIAIALPATWVAALEDGLRRLARDERRSVAFVAAAAAAVAVATAWSQQPRAWDEPLLLPAARIVADEGLSAFFSRYASIPWLGTNHPPLVVVVFGFAIRALGDDLMLLRLLSAAAGVATVLSCHAIARRLVGRRTALLAALVLLASPLFDRMAGAAMNDIFVTLCFVAAIQLAIGRPRAGIGLGLVIAAGLLSKYTMLLVYPVVGAIAAARGELRTRRRELAVAAAISLAIFAAWLAAAWQLGVFALQRAWMARVSGVATRSSRGFGYALDALFTKLPSGLGVYDVPIVAWGVLQARVLGGRTAAVLGCWIALVSLPLLATLPDNRYFLPAYPALAILGGHGLARLGDGFGRVLVLAGLLCAVTLGYYASVDLSGRAFLFRTLLAPGR